MGMGIDDWDDPDLGPLLLIAIAAVIIVMIVMSR
jgi:hypothetical protein